MVELAICLPLLMTIFCAIIEFGFLFYNTLRVFDGVREGARQASRGTFDDAIIQLVEEYRPVLGMNNLVVTVRVYDAGGTLFSTRDSSSTGAGQTNNRQAGQEVHVLATCNVDWLTPLSALLQLVPIPVNVKAVSLIQPDRM